MDDQARTKQLFSSFPTGIAVLAAIEDGERFAMPVAAFSVGVSLDPPLVSAALTRTSTTWPRLRSAARIGVSILDEAQAGILRQLTAPDRSRRWDGIDPVVREGSALILPGAAAWMVVELAAVHSAGDHELALLRLHDQGLREGSDPLVYYRARSHGLGESLEPR
ncbi:flavin reductase family protein [Brachybacterium hainanense]|uniref:Flavin reductase family protein n=1 Tax=Brachybacterium hainanense TaxID=1541174 RepID=A0ABV6RDC5_9MICO